jgi:phosphate transport system permease protein
VYGGLPLIVGTFVSATGAIVLGAAPAVLSAVWLTEFSPESVRRGYRRVMEVASAIPSVVYGWLALVYLVPVMEHVAHTLKGADAPVTGEGLASSAVLLAIMVAPTVLLLSLDALARVPSALREASAALGASPWQTAFRVSLPYAWRGVLVAVFFGFARAAGETMAVQMVIGGARRLPKELLFSPTTTISAQIVMDMQEARPDTTQSDTLYSMALILLVVSVAVVLVTRALGRQKAR